jgi:hypothetical protein
VKQSDLGEYGENAKGKNNIQYTGKNTISPQTKANHKLPIKPNHMDDNIKFQTQEGSKKSTRFLNAKDHTPPEPRQIKSSVKFNQRRQLP